MNEILRAEEDIEPTPPQCDVCRVVRGTEQTRRVDNEDITICDVCYGQVESCYYCDGRFTGMDLLEDRGCFTCSRCASDNGCFTCEVCGEYLSGDAYWGDDRCYSCQDNQRENGRYEEVKADIATNAHISNDDGNVVSSKRIFSCEIECYHKEDGAYLVDDIVGDFEGIGAVHDGSLNDNGVEFVSPRLGGKSGEKFLIDLSARLRKEKFHVDRACGLHIHIDGKRLIPKNVREQNIEPGTLKNILLFYLNFDDVILSFLPMSRRGNTYCMPLSYNYNSKEISDCKNLDDIERLWYREPNKDQREQRKGNKYDGSRYSGLNMHSLLANNHLEVRYHGGTTDVYKILYWVAMHLRIIDRIATGKIKANDLLNNDIVRTHENKMSKFFCLLDLSPKIERYFIDRYRKFKPVQQDETEIEDGITTGELVVGGNRFAGMSLSYMMSIARTGDITKEEFETMNTERRKNAMYNCMINEEKLNDRIAELEAREVGISSMDWLAEHYIYETIVQFDRTRLQNNYKIL